MRASAVLTLLAGLALPASCATMTLSGLDVLEQDGFKALRNRRVGLITNHTAINLQGRHAADLLHGAGVDLAAIFAPEHGFRGTEDHGAHIAHSSDAVTGAPIYSLYGRNMRPSPEQLAGLDILVFDIQDVGARFYTYLTTMGYAMEEAAKAGISFMVLDRPNPAGGHIVEGPVLEEGVRAFTAYFPVPPRHGFTAGEMALFHRDGLRLALDLVVVRMENWRREMFFDETGLVWTNPSPNIRTVEAEILYPGIGCFESTNLSVGRGTASPFTWFGAPWLDGDKLAAELNDIGLPGASFTAVKKTPSSDVYAGKECGGVEVEITDRHALRSLDIFVHACALMKKAHPRDFSYRPAELRKMTGSGLLGEALQKGRPAGAVIKKYARESAAFQKNRAKWLLY
ncbi:MAG: hypothetical protein FD189_2171 [Elusimicrobia bacterium]|nr:MAG: hypothetical protein FD154_1386 [Elusimicrobiota bacterium]KAF0153961.1 MAG: hypothetical protein FD189_2171 [Elusimicrobiota bacterium]